MVTQEVEQRFQIINIIDAGVLNQPLVDGQRIRPYSILPEVIERWESRFGEKQMKDVERLELYLSSTQFFGNSSVFLTKLYQTR